MRKRYRQRRRFKRRKKRGVTRRSLPRYIDGRGGIRL